MSNTNNYKLVEDIISGNIQSVKLTDASGAIAFVPFDDGNKDYQEYLEWVDEGNTPQSPDQPNNWEVIRQKRDRLIRESDWTMTPGATVDQAQWTAYRQVLRDLPQTYENAEDVVWPTVPSTSGPNTIEE
jgi:hypothetical protein